MNELENDFDIQEKEQEEQLAKLLGKKWQIWRLIAVGVLIPLVLPYFPSRRGTLSYDDKVLICLVIVLIAVPYGCYMHFQKINSEISEIETDLEILRRNKEIKLNLTKLGEKEPQQF